MKRSTRSKFSAVELRDAAKRGDLKRTQESWASYLEGDVSEKYKVRSRRSAAKAMNNDAVKSGG
jgi:hypothetical protein